MILFYGEILADVVMDDEGRMNAFIGGAPFNAAVSAARSGSEALFVGRVGEDPLGRFLERQAACFPVRTFLQKDKVRPTTIAFVSISASGERDFRFLRHDAADEALRVDSRFISSRKPKIVHIGSLMLSSSRGRKNAEKIIASAKKIGALVSFDVNFRSDIFKNKQSAIEAYMPVIEQADILKYSEEETEILYGLSYKEALPHMKNRLVCVTLGKEGCYVKSGGTELFVPTAPVKTVDTTGAGDAFFGAFLSGVDRTETLTMDVLRTIASDANVAGARATQHKGAILP